MTEERIAKATHVAVTDDTLSVRLGDGHCIHAPLDGYPRLVHATPKERNNWRLIADGEGIHWEDIDEDIRIENLMAGRGSGESARSFKRWLKTKNEERGLTLYELRQTEQGEGGESR